MEAELAAAVVVIVEDGGGRMELAAFFCCRDLRLLCGWVSKWKEGW